MKSSWWYRFSFLILIVVVSVMMILPTAFKFSEDSSFPVKSKINLGLDLQGGLYLILGIDFKQVYRDEIKGHASKFVKLLESEGIKSELGDLMNGNTLDPQYSLKNVSEPEKAKDVIKKFYNQRVRLTSEEGGTLNYGLTTFLKSDIENQAVKKSIEVIRNRIDEFGVTEPEIFSQGNDRIVVQLPGVRDVERAKSLIGQTAKLEFKLVNDTVPLNKLNSLVKKANDEGIVYKKGTKFSQFLYRLNEFVKDDLPKGYELAFQKIKGKGDLPDQKVPFLVEKVSHLTGDDLQDAGVQIDPQKNRPYVSMDFKSEGAKKFETLTGENVGKRMAVILDGNVYTAPVINSRIGGGRAQITLGYGQFEALIKQAKDIALVLRAGALPVQLDFQEQRVVGPSLGADSIKSARTAAIIGCIAVVLFIVLFYKFSGFIAVIGLGLNVLFVLACLVALDATLTLPGIAGIALTVGMAIDATIIIYERIREELRDGDPPLKAVHDGFNQAFWTIIDANITTALAGFCLFNFGTGPVRGFAVTLLIGIACTVYTAYFVGELLFEAYMHSVGGRDLSI